MKNKKVQQSEGQIWGGNLKVMRQQILLIKIVQVGEKKRWCPGDKNRMEGRHKMYFPSGNKRFYFLGMRDGKERREK